ncbi:MAG TPA: isocitrate lyase/phosphoenolpyruvate mutase family protein [Streptosporangiaceae bacterium]|nr:isocitrate lyase/phosphoenolpyruvate mutase family protein [Streptosporangiaceae bacterium]
MGSSHLTTQADKAEQFLALHHGPDVLRLPNPWDAGSARLLAALGFAALATTSSGFAATLGRPDGTVSLDEALAHGAAVAAATNVPVSADLENGFADDPEGVARTVRLAKEAGLAGCSVEDFSAGDLGPIYDKALAVERIAAASAAAKQPPGRLVLTARAENYLHGRPDLDDTISRLVAYQEAGADVLYAPGLTSLDDVRAVVGALDRPVNVLLLRGGPSIPELHQAGVRRVSVGGSLAFAALEAVVTAARELREDESYGFLDRAAAGRAAAADAFGG